MSIKYFDILVAKEFEVQQNGQPERRKVWNRVGQAWASKVPGCFNFELFLMPGQRYFLKLRDGERAIGESPETRIEPKFDEFNETAPF